MLKRLLQKLAEYERRELEKPRPIMEWLSIVADRHFDRIRAAYWMWMVLWLPFLLSFWGVRPFHHLNAFAPDWALVTVSLTGFPVVFAYYLMLDARHPRFLCRARARRGLCERCGYDLRASPSSCPECGHTRKIGIE